MVTQPFIYWVLLCVRHHCRWADPIANKTEKAPLPVVSNSSKRRWAISKNEQYVGQDKVLRREMKQAKGRDCAYGECYWNKLFGIGLSEEVIFEQESARKEEAAMWITQRKAFQPGEWERADEAPRPERAWRVWGNQCCCARYCVNRGQRWTKQVVSSHGTVWVALLLVKAMRYILWAN